MSTQSAANARPNASAIEAWDTVLFDKWVRFRHVVRDGLGAHAPMAMERLGPIAKQRVLDVGCGFGHSTQELARRTGPDGEVVGVDCAQRFIHIAADEARTAQVDNARFGVRDVQTDDLGGPYDAAFSQYGVMFFDNAVQALKNIRRSLRDNGTLCMLVWRKREDNPCFHVAELIVKRMVTIPEETDAATCGPGPFSMSGADVVSDQLIKAGFTNISFTRNDMKILIGRDLDDAIDFALAIGPGGEDLRLSGEDGEKKMPQITAALRDGLAPFVTADGSVHAPSSTWIIRATARPTPQDRASKV